jgi:cyclic-di-AMP phosphodiesterase PgpH
MPHNDKKVAKKANGSKAVNHLRPLQCLEHPEHEPWPVLHRLRRAYALICSPKGRTVAAGVVLTFCLTLLLGYQYLNVVQVANNGLASTRIEATQLLQVPDEEATELKRRQARNAITPTYKDKAPLETHIMEALEVKVSRLQSLFKAWAEEKKNAAKTNMSDELDSTFRQDLTEELGLEASPNRGEQLASLLSTEPQLWQKPVTWDRLRLAGQLGLKKVLKQGLTVETYLEQREALVKAALPGNLLHGAEERQLGQWLILSVLTPTLVVDEESTHFAYLKAEAKVTPVIVTFQAGQAIVERGEPLTALKKQALAQQGLAVEGVHWPGLLGVALLSGLFSGLFFAFLKLFQKGRYFAPSYGWMFASLTVFMVGVLRLQLQYLNWLPLVLFPLPAYALTLSILTQARLGLVATTGLVFLVGLGLHLDFQPLAIVLLGALGGTLWLDCHQPFTSRKQLMVTILYVCLLSGLGLLTFFFLNQNGAQHWQMQRLVLWLGAGILNGVLSGVFTMGLLPFLESAFKLLTPFTLLELANHDQPLLKRLQFEAPGTFHHSLLVASLSEAAAEAIQADSLLTRVGCLYHDVGKMKRPLYFIENQAYFGSDNPHDRLTPRLSKRVITQHPKDSLDLGKEYGLPEAIMAFMTEHHGTLLCGYFYQKALKEEGPEHVEKAHFRYAGPKPRSRETAIVMLADAAESAVRALKNPSMAQMEELIGKLFKQRLDDGQFDRCPMTLQELHTVKETFVRVLMGIQHNRINYQDKISKEFAGKASVKG